MQIILASAKTMNEAPGSIAAQEAVSTPVFLAQAGRLAQELAQQSAATLARSLKCSPALARTNVLRYHHFFDSDGRQPAIFAYNGTAYKHLAASSLTADELSFAQHHLHILSFLYGMLRPLDAIHPYRLEGSVRLAATGGETLFSFWKPLLTEYLIRTMKADDGILFHLATEEFEHLFDWKRVERELTVIHPLFYVDNGQQFKVMAMHAKACRGAMTRHLIVHRANRIEELTGFAYNGFIYQPNLGDELHPHYIKQI